MPIASMLAVVLAVAALSTGLLVLGAVTIGDDDDAEYAAFAADREDWDLDRS